MSDATRRRGEPVSPPTASIPTPPGPGPDGEPELGDVLEFMRVLWAVDHGLQSVSKQMLRTLGVTGPQRLVIRLVGRFPDIGARRLSDILHIHPSTLTGVLRRLEERGLLTRRADPDDARRVLLTLTPLGRGLNKTRSETAEARVSAVLARQPAARIEAARALLEELAIHLNKD